MILIAELVLTIFAWRRGWKWYSLLPVGCALVVGLIIGFIIGFSGGGQAELNAIKPLGLMIDLLAIGALIFMVAKKRYVKEVKS